ncbi:MAG: dihydropteroate synthase [Clostridia bacterium]|nr:dihydropteroate synthase [Clostridia bacterium]
MHVAHTPKQWRIAGQTITLDRTYIMGILNVTPDSFSDGGQYASVASAVARACEMQEQGADIIDIGGQSTRPGHTPVSPDEEWRRLAPVLQALCGKITVPVSVDTYYPEVARKAADIGVQIFNDVTGFRDPLMRQYAAQYGVGCVIMHDIELDESADVCAELRAFYKTRTAECIADGIAPDCICLDPGVGFGKSYEQNLAIAARFAEQCYEHYPMLAAASRKRVIGLSCGNPPANQRVSGTVAYHTACMLGGANLIRVHDVSEAVQAARVIDAVMGRNAED